MTSPAGRTKAYRVVSRRAKELGREIRAADKALSEANRDLGSNAWRQGQRYREMSGLRRAAHNLGVWRDSDLQRFEAEREQLGRTIGNLTERRAELGRERDAAEQDRAARFEPLRPAVERELQERQNRAQAARGVRMATDRGRCQKRRGTRGVMVNAARARNRPSPRDVENRGTLFPPLKGGDDGSDGCDHRHN
jgi:chromosome segregation ATPase